MRRAALAVVAPAPPRSPSRRSCRTATCRERSTRAPRAPRPTRRRASTRSWPPPAASAAGRRSRATGGPASGPTSGSSATRPSCRSCGRVPEPLLQHELLAAGGGRVESGGAACGRRELSGCVVESRFAAAPPQAAAAPQRGRKPPSELGRAARGARAAVDAWRAWAAAHEFWSSAALFGAAPPRPRRAARARGGPRRAAALDRRPRAPRRLLPRGRLHGPHVQRRRGLRARGLRPRARYGFGTLVVATDSDAALAELRAALPACGWPASAPVVATPAAARGGRQDGDKADARIEDLMAAGVVDAAEEFAAVLVDVTVLSDCDAFVGKFTSNLDRLAYALLVFRRQTLAPYASLDTAWSKDTPALYDPAVHGPLQATLAAAEHKSRLRNATRKKLQVADCATPRATPGWSDAPRSRWWCPATTS
ncbi:glycoprotein 6-alpha-L-fucosyltransferase [Aureococcus anophagefferens]|nr:glycoprotein 6-alpha-L-fucosyltransferase [Aureococcus anophagefferens]